MTAPDFHTARRFTKAEPAAGMHLTVEETETRDAIKHCGKTVAYLNIGYESWGPLFAAAPQLLALAKQYVSECGECAGVGITVEDEDCAECKPIRDLIKRTET